MFRLRGGERSDAFVHLGMCERSGAFVHLGMCERSGAFAHLVLLACGERIEAFAVNVRTLRSVRPFGNVRTLRSVRTFPNGHHSQMCERIDAFASKKV